MRDPADDISFDDARRIVRDTPAVAEHAETLIADLEPFVRVWPGEPGYPADPLASRFGGDRAMMLPEHGWPTRVYEPYHGQDHSAETFTLTYGAAEEKPLKFLAQVNLAELPPGDGIPLPREGLLSFFADTDEAYGAEPGEQDAFRLFHTPPSRFGELRERPMPNMRTTSVFGNDPLPPFEMRLGLAWRPAYGSGRQAGRPRLDRDGFMELTRKLKGGGYDDNGILTLPGARGEPPQYLAHLHAKFATEEEREAADTEAFEAEMAQAFRDWIVLFNLSSNDDLKLNSSLWHLAFLVRRADAAAGQFGRYWGSVSV